MITVVRPCAYYRNNNTMTYINSYSYWHTWHSQSTNTESHKEEYKSLHHDFPFVVTCSLHQKAPLYIAC